jgi:hypothetical protein
VSVAATRLTSGINGTDATSFTTASISPAANNLILAVCASYANVGVASPVVDSVTGGGMTTWDSVGTIQQNDSGILLEQLTIFRALQASPTSGTLTFNFGTDSLEICAWSIVQFSGVETSGTNGDTAVRQSKFSFSSPSVTTPSVTFDASTVPGNGTFGAIANSSGSRAITQGGSFIELSEDTTTVGGNLDLETEFANSGINAVNWTISAGGDVSIYAGVEIQQAPGSPQAPRDYPPSRFGPF